VINDPDLTLDPKRYCRKVIMLRKKLSSKKHVLLGDIVEFIPERISSLGVASKIKPSKLYKYVEIQDMGYGDYNLTEMRGWQLPSRARHFAENEDIYFGSIWGSVVKWCYIGKGTENIVVTNGCHRCRMKVGKETFLLDLLAYLNTEGWGVQLRSFSRGSDGLAEVSITDANQVIIPIIEDNFVRNEIQPFIDNLKEGRVAISTTIGQLLLNKQWKLDEPKSRPSHIVLV
jgi:type I restriction enzyme M protein